MADGEHLRRLQRRVYGPDADMAAPDELAAYLDGSAPASAPSPVVGGDAAHESRRPTAQRRVSASRAAALLAVLIVVAFGPATSTQSGPLGARCPSGWICHREGRLILEEPNPSTMSTNSASWTRAIILDPATGRIQRTMSGCVKVYTTAADGQATLISAVNTDGRAPSTHTCSSASTADAPPAERRSPSPGR